jgi:hypothetical protein
MHKTNDRTPLPHWAEERNSIFDIHHNIDIPSVAEKRKWRA